MPYTQSDYEAHLEQEHKRSPLSTYLREIVYGGNDGIVTTFAVVAGFTGAASGSVGEYSIATVLLFGLANLFADGASMGLGSFLSIRSDQKIYAAEKRKERHEIANATKSERQETEYLLRQKGYSADDAKKMTDLYAKNPDYWAEFMMHQELEMSNPEGENPLWNAIATFIAFLFFGFIPIVPYLFITDVIPAFRLSIAATVLSLSMLGLLRGMVTEESRLHTLGETLLIGGTAASLAYFVGTLF